MILIRCQAQTEINLSFRSMSDSTLMSNIFEIFKFRESPLLSISCWLKVCAQNSECLQRMCAETAALSFSNSNHLFENRKSKVARNVLRASNDESLGKERSLYKEASIRLVVEDPYGLSQKIDKTRLQQSNLPSSIGNLINLK